MTEASNKLLEFILAEKMEMKNPQIPVVSNADATFLNNAETIKVSLIKQINSPVLWEDSIKTIVNSGINTFVETGPGKVLSGLIKRIEPEAVIFNVEDMESLEKTVAGLKDIKE